MATLDPIVAHTLDHQQDSSDDEALFDSLENDSSLDHLREARLTQLHAQLQATRTLKQLPGHGTYQEIKDEKELLAITTSKEAPLCVVHFMKPDFNRCRIMDGRLSVLAEKHLETRFVSVNVENAAFVVTKLGIQVLPCVVCFKAGLGVGRVLGFEGLGNGHSFSVQELEAKLLSFGVLDRSKVVDEDGQGRMLRERGEEMEDEGMDEDEEW
ncbi:hypothetical protein LTR15_011529 [Elasticomyces elasticus]|nr:hypothetical protein LTR15_011529 [Elasticomyces elasticus]